MPFGRPRDVEAVRADPRYAELRAHIWHELEGRAAGEGGVSVSVQTGTAVRDGAAAAETALARKAAVGRRRQRQILTVAIRLTSLVVVLGLWQILGARVDASLFTTPSAIARPRSR